MQRTFYIFTGNNDIQNPEYAVATKSQVHMVYLLHSDLVQVDPDG